MLSQLLGVILPLCNHATAVLKCWNSGMPHFVNSSTKVCISRSRHRTEIAAEHEESEFGEIGSARRRLPQDQRKGSTHGMR
jgi:hypothetical protein